MTLYTLIDLRTINRLLNKFNHVKKNLIYFIFLENNFSY